MPEQTSAKPCSIEGCDRCAICRGWCRRHYGNWSRTGEPVRVRPTVFDTFWLKVEKDQSGCWLWTAAINQFGYGSTGKGPGKPGTMLAHRFAYEYLVGSIPPGMTIDHLCRVRNCVNPQHLEPVPYAENRRREYERRTVCKNGHPVTTENIAHRPDRPNARECRACRVLHRERAKARRSADQCSR